MPARKDIKSICVLGSGPIVIGQAAEFDYSGVQAVKALKQDGYRIILVNSNPATIMTDPGLADATYVEPLVPEVLEAILEKEKPDAVLPTVGGQTALNLALELDKRGILERLGVELIGAKADVIDKAENRERFKKCMDEIGLGSARSAVVHTLEEAKAAQKDLGMPIVIRPSFTLGGSGGGIAHDMEQFETIVSRGLEESPTTEVLLEESMLGWKEYELEVVRDLNDNVVIVCAIENLDPMGVHTGDSITVAPAQTLTDREYQRLRDAAIAILRAIGVETGGSNVQFAVDPKTGRLIVIEMNPRVSRSSALASKATGFPIAKVAAKLAVGYTLEEIDNDITKKTKAAFEPSLDYVVTKVPRFAFEKFRGAERFLTTQMKSVGEVMAIGRSFVESMGKALQSLEVGASGIGVEGVKKAGGIAPDAHTVEELIEAATKPAPERIWIVAEALRQGAEPDDLARRTGIDPWFIGQLEIILNEEKRVAEEGLDKQTVSKMLALKQAGLSDARIAALTGNTDIEVRTKRKELGVLPVMKRVDTCAAEFEAFTPYLYSAYEVPFARMIDGRLVWGTECEARPTGKDKVIILGGGPIRIGQGIEFDYCCVHAAQAITEAGYESVMVNCNPETVSTDYDTSDRLYFEPLTLEHVLDIVDREQPIGVIVSFGGQTPLKLAQRLNALGVPILGTSPDAIDRAEDRERSNALVEKLGLEQPQGGVARSEEEAIALATELGYPVMIRPSYVLGGRAMEAVHAQEELEAYLRDAVTASEDRPVLVDRFLEGAVEVDVDVVCDGTRAVVGGVMQHIHEAGVHSGDSACVLPPHSLDVPIVEEIAAASRELALELGVKGLMNAQFAVRRGRVYVIEVNPRASRTVPFVSKATGVPLARVATRVMLGESLDDMGVVEQRLTLRDGDRVAVKEAVLPFRKFPGVDPLLGPEMRSTGEVMGVGLDATDAYTKSQVAAGVKLPEAGTVFVSVADVDKEAVVEPTKQLLKAGFTILATAGTARYLEGLGVDCLRVNKVREGAPDIVDMMRDGKVQLVFNSTVGIRAIQDSATIRQAALKAQIPYFTTVSAMEAVSDAIVRLVEHRPVSVMSLQDHLAVRGVAPAPTVA
jgi:carbamoyl-phosphate synthase large subunit